MVQLGEMKVFASLQVLSFGVVGFQEPPKLVFVEAVRLVRLLLCHHPIGLLTGEADVRHHLHYFLQETFVLV